MIRWITANLGTGPRNDVRETDGVPIDVRELVDKDGNSADAVRRLVESVASQLREGKRVVVCCDFGMSRSNAVAAGALAVFEQISFDKALSRVMDATGERAIKLEVVSAVREAVEPLSKPRQSAGDRKTILVTGGSGFLGKALLARLGTVHDVVAPDRRALDLAAGAASIDLFVRQHGVTDILHLANPRAYSTSEAMGETLVMLRNVLDACRENSLRLIFLSGWEVYSGYACNGLLAGEHLSPLPHGPYGEAKYLCECLLEKHQQRHGLRVALVRLGPVYGPGGEKPRFIHTFIRQALVGQPIVTHRYLNADPSLDLLYVDDATQILSLIVGGGYCGTLNVGSDRPITTPEVARHIVALLGSRSPISHARVDARVANIVMDTRKVKSIFGWSAQTSIEQGLERVCRQFGDSRRPTA